MSFCTSITFSVSQFISSQTAVRRLGCSFASMENHTVNIQSISDELQRCLQSFVGQPVSSQTLLEAEQWLIPLLAKRPDDIEFRTWFRTTAMPDKIVIALNEHHFCHSYPHIPLWVWNLMWSCNRRFDTLEEFQSAFAVSRNLVPDRPIFINFTVYKDGTTIE